MRLDLFLKWSRVILRRTLAKEMCDAGRVTVNGRAFDDYFPTAIHRNNATEALRIQA